MAGALSGIGTSGAGKGLFKFISNNLLRAVIEVIFSSIPGAAIFFIFILGTGILNIYTNIGGANNVFAATYLPVICVLPIVIGIIGSLILEKVRDDARLSLRASVLVSFVSALAGSFLGTIVLVISGLMGGFMPFGAILPGLTGLVGAFIVLVAASTLLSTIGGALIVVLLKRAER
ncbi:MAG: hypothetical protein ABIH83_01485 [Candidatus Micrarchaeota archaeon]